jgi:CMP/dCMP kinase
MKTTPRAQVVAIDGPSYVGKSTISRELADRMGYLYVNTGHMYRAIGRIARERGIDPKDAEAIVAIAKTTDFKFVSGKGFCGTVVNGKDWTRELDHQDIVFFASQISGIRELRDILTAKQRDFSQEHPIVMEGRDIGTVVFPDAMWKFYITASVDIRAWRMYKIMTEDEKRQCSDYRTLTPKIERLDEIDRNREIAPLKLADDAVIYDNSTSPTEVQDAIILQYYMTHHGEILRNAGLLKERVV